MNFGLRLSNNLFTSGRFFGFHLEKDSPQIAGLGIHYTFGEEGFWTVSFQRSAINGLSDFRLVSSSFNLEKYIEKSIEFYRDVLGFEVSRIMDESGDHIDAFSNLKDVKVKTILTKSGKNLVTPLSITSLTNNKVYIDSLGCLLYTSPSPRDS